MPLADGGLFFIVYTPFPDPVLKFAKTIAVSLARFRFLVGSPGLGTQDLSSNYRMEGLYSVTIHTLPKSERNALSIERKTRKGRRLYVARVKDRFLSSDFGFTQVIKCFKKSPMYAQSGT